MEKGHKLKTILADATGAPEELRSSGPVVELIGNRRMLVEQHCGVCEYTDSMIQIRCRHGALHICGSNLRIARMTKQQLVVTGCIRSVEFGQVGQ